MHIYPACVPPLDGGRGVPKSSGQAHVHCHASADTRSQAPTPLNPHPQQQCERYLRLPVGCGETRLTVGAGNGILGSHMAVIKRRWPYPILPGRHTYTHCHASTDTRSQAPTPLNPHPQQQCERYLRLPVGCGETRLTVGAGNGILGSHMAVIKRRWPYPILPGRHTYTHCHASTDTRSQAPTPLNPHPQQQCERYLGLPVGCGETRLTVGAGNGILGSHMAVKDGTTFMCLWNVRVCVFGA
eukprot:GHVU01178726.1.p2 GENE.GHVU01178726.1~~GHVU01178726.1.p2  ORF type:complete len:242 (+),score=4.57 GHVU01178726.1:537-1262(+)